MFKQLSSHLSANSQISNLLVIGLITHVLTIIIVSISGYLQIFPTQILPSGILAGDSVSYLEKCQELSARIHNGDFSFFFTNDYDVHLKIYTLSYFVFSNIFGNSIFCFELINVVLFLTLLLLVYKIGELCFSPKVGFWSALVINFSPTFLVHSVQPLRDPLYICLFCASIYYLLTISYKNLNINQFLKLLVSLYIIILFLWMIRDNAFPVFLAISLVGFILFLIGKWGTHKSHLPQISLYGVFIFSIMLMPTFFSSLQPKPFWSGVVSKEKKEKSQNFSQKQLEKGVPNSVRYLNGIRRGVNYQNETEDGSSAMDRNVVFESWGEVILYSPKAVLIGIFSPFPNMWFEDGKMFGRVGRLVAAFEVLIIYILSAFSLLTFYYQRKNFGFWLIGLTVLIGCGALGFVVTNIGTLYRMRYVFWFLLVILGINGIVALISFRQLKNTNLITQKFPTANS